MARVEIASQSWGVLIDATGRPLAGQSATLKNLDGTNATIWTAVTGGSSNTTALSTDTLGGLGQSSATRYVEEGTYTITVGALTRRVGAVSGGYASDAGTALRDTLANLTNADPFDFAFAAIHKTANTTANFDGGFFGVDIVTAATTKAHCALQSVIRNTVAGGSGWGFNALAVTNQDHTSGNGIWAGEFDVNFNGATDSGSIFSGAQNVRGVTVASGGTKRPQFAIGVEHGAGKAPFYYGIRFASDATDASVYDGGSDIISQVQSTSHALWTVHVLQDPDPVFRVLPDRIEFGSTASGLDTMFRRGGAGALITDTTTLQSWHLYATNSLEVRGTGGNGYLQLDEQSSAPSGNTDKARLFARDNGASKTQLCVQFATGAVQVLATQP